MGRDRMGATRQVGRGSDRNGRAITAGQAWLGGAGMGNHGRQGMDRTGVDWRYMAGGARKGKDRIGVTRQAGIGQERIGKDWKGDTRQAR